MQTAQCGVLANVAFIAKSLESTATHCEMTDNTFDNSFGLLQEDTGPERWADIETKALINLWGEYLEEIRKGGRNSGVFRKIALDLQVQLNRSVPRTAKEVKYKIENLKKQYNRQIRHVKRLGVDNPSAIPWRFFKFIDRFMNVNTGTCSSNESRVSPAHQAAMLDEDGYVGGKLPLQVLLHGPSDNQTLNAFKNVLSLGQNSLNPLILSQFASYFTDNNVINSHIESENSNVEDQSNESEHECCKLEEPAAEMEDDDPEVKVENRSNSPESHRNSDDIMDTANFPSWLEEACLAKLNVKQLEMENAAKELSERARELKEREKKVTELEERFKINRLDFEEREERLRRDRRQWEERQDRERRSWEERQDRLRRDWEERQDRLRREWESRQDRLNRDWERHKRPNSTSIENGPV